MIFNARENSVEVNGGRMSYVVFGGGQRTLVIIPGLSLQSIHGYALSLAWMYRIFAKDYRVYVFDKKDEIEADCTVSSLAEDLASAMLRLGIDQADVIGISQGGMIAQYLALDHPDLVRKLVLGVTLCRTNDTVRGAVGRWIGYAERGDRSAFISDMLNSMYSEDYVRKYGRFFPLVEKVVKMNSPKRFIALAKSCLSCDTYDRLAELSCPVLVIGGAEDKIVTAAASSEIAERLGCHCHIYEGLGHAAYEEAKDFNRRVYDFLKA